MPVFITPGQLPKKPKKKIIKGRPVKPAKSAAVSYQSVMADQVKMMTSTIDEIVAGIRSGRLGKSEALVMLDLKHDEMNRMFAARGQVAADAFVVRVSTIQKRRLEGVLARGFGVNVLNIVQTEGIEKVFATAISENVNLIKTIPQDYFLEIQKTVVDNFAGVPPPEGRTLTQQIQQIGKDTKARPKLIARDQTSKLNATFNEVRQKSVGIDSYIWQTSEDSRVVGDPAGMYPDGNAMHGNHFSRNGKVFKWAEPPSDGHPGEPINCRCVAVPLLDRDELDVIE